MIHHKRHQENDLFDGSGWLSGILRKAREAGFFANDLHGYIGGTWGACFSLGTHAEGSTSEGI